MRAKYCIAFVIASLLLTFHLNAQSAADEVHRRFLERLAIGAEQGEMAGKPIETFMREEKIALLEGTFSDLKALCRDTAAVMEMSMLDGKRYAVRFTREGSRSAAIAYPVDYQLIIGVTMMEAEDRLEQAVRMTPLPPIDTTKTVAADLLKQVGTSPLYLLSGTSYILPELNCNRYYVRIDDRSTHYEPLVSEDFPLESMANLVTSNDLDGGISITITQVKYGYRIQTFTVPLRQWVTFCLAEGCQPYYGVISHERDNVVCEVVMQNESLGYAHVMKMTFNPAILSDQWPVASGHPREATARLNSYVPISNVKALFDEKE